MHQKIDIHELLRSDESELKSILDNLLSLVAVTDLQGHFTFTGKSHQILGYEEGYLIGKNVMEFVHPDDLPEVQAGFADFMKNKRSGARATYRNRCADGSYLWFETIGNLVSGPDGNPREIVFNTRNITGRMQAEADLRMSESRFKSIIAVSNTGAWEYFHDTDYIWCSPEYFTMLGYDPEDFNKDDTINLARRWIDLLHPDDRDKATRHFKEYLDGGSVGMYENHFRMQHRDGGWVWIWSRGQTLRDSQGKLTNRTVGTHIDVSESKQAEQKLRAVEAEKSALLEANPDLMFLFDREGHFVDYEAANQKELLKEPTAFLKKHVSAILPPEVAQITLDHLSRVFASGESVIYEYPMNLSGKSEFFESRMVPCDNERALAIVRNITDKKHKEIREQLLFEIANATFFSEDLEALLANIKVLLHELIDTTNFYIALYDQESDLFSTPYQADEKDQIETWPAKNSITGLVVHQKKALLLKKPELLEILKSDEVEQIGNMCAV